MLSKADTTLPCRNNKLSLESFILFAVSSIFPSETWNSKLRMIELENIFEKLLLPSLPQLHACGNYVLHYQKFRVKVKSFFSII